MGSQVNKFAQVSSNCYQMSLVGGRGQVGGGGVPCLMLEERGPVQ